jgi:hypothetical protein
MTASSLLLGILLQDALTQTQDAPAQTGNAVTVRIIAGVLALILVAIVIVRRKLKAKKEEEEEEDEF